MLPSACRTCPLANSTWNFTTHRPDLQTPRLLKTQDKVFTNQFTHISPPPKYSSLRSGCFKL